MFLNDRFNRLSEFLAREAMHFPSRQERCFFCTKFIMTGLGDLRGGPL